jgi:peptidoglycan/LPS O-acetylase OafA/YrhL
MTPFTVQADPWATLLYACSIYGAMWWLSRGLLLTRPVDAALTPVQERHGCLDGLRGVLAIGVLVHHSIVGYVYQREGSWASGSNPVVNHLGETTVALFFMITGFLFTEKACGQRVDWIRFYSSRLARLLPLYACLVVAVFLLVLGESGWVLRVPAPALALEFVQWLAFVVFGRPDINDVSMSWTRIAGVNWSLQYEALFYLLGVPALFLAARRLGPRARLVAALLLLAPLLALALVKGRIGGPPLYIAHFLCGIVAAHVHDDPALRPIWRHPAVRIVAAACAAALGWFTDAWSFGAVVLTFVIFMAVVGGGSVFGLLRTSPARWLGDVSYGTYLLHGLVLWLAFKLLRAGTGSVDLSLPGYCLFAVGVAGVVVGLASLSYIVLEKPMIEWARRRPPAGTPAAAR